MDVPKTENSNLLFSNLLLSHSLLHKHPLCFRYGMVSPPQLLGDAASSLCSASHFCEADSVPLSSPLCVTLYLSPSLHVHLPVTRTHPA